MSNNVLIERVHFESLCSLKKVPSPDGTKSLCVYTFPVVIITRWEGMSVTKRRLEMVPLREAKNMIKDTFLKASPTYTCLFEISHNGKPICTVNAINGSQWHLTKFSDDLFPNHMWVSEAELQTHFSDSNILLPPLFSSIPTNMME